MCTVANKIFASGSDERMYMYNASNTTKISLDGIFEVQHQVLCGLQRRNKTYFGGTKGVVSVMIGVDIGTFFGTDLNNLLKTRVGDINCISETDHPEYIMVGVDNFTIYLLKVGKE
jgi:hypothetical protein